MRSVFGMERGERCSNGAGRALVTVGSGKNGPVLHHLLDLLCFLFPGSRAFPASQMPLEQTIGGEDVVGGKPGPDPSSHEVRRAFVAGSREGGLCLRSPFSEARRTVTATCEGPRTNTRLSSATCQNELHPGPFPDSSPGIL